LIGPILKVFAFDVQFFDGFKGIQKSWKVIEALIWRVH
jgi:hypothetical protein